MVVENSIMGIPSEFVSDNGVKMFLAHTSGWRAIFTCSDCGDHTDSDEHKNICPACGGEDFTCKVGRWHAYHPNSTIWQGVKAFFTDFKIPFVLFKVEIKGEVK